MSHKESYLMSRFLKKSEVVIHRLRFCHKYNCQLSSYQNLRKMFFSVHKIYNGLLVLHWEYMNTTSVYLLLFKVQFIL